MLRISRIRRVFLVTCALLLALLPAVVLADDATTGATPDDLTLRIAGSYTVPAGEQIGSLVVIDGDATIEGTVQNTLVVISGNAVISGVVDGDITLVSGTLELRDTARVTSAVNVIRGDLVRAPGAVVAGDITETSGYSFGWTFAIVSALLWLGVTLLILVAGLVFAAIGRRQLQGAGTLLTASPVGTTLSALLLWIALPALALGAVITIVGIPFAIGIALFLLPAMWFIGYLVAGTQLGSLLIARRIDPQRRSHLYVAALVGIGLLQIVGWVPGIGPLIGALAGLGGGGALALYAWRSWRGERPASATKAPVIQPIPAT
jgi:hypothetical protein